MKKFILIGSVESSNIFLEESIKIGLKPIHVFGLKEEYSNNVSGYYPICKTAEKNDIPFTEFRKINDKENVEKIKRLEADFIFVIGLSQLVSKEIISSAKEYAVGLHPTKLPKYRGRAAIPWLILLGEEESALTLFKIDEGMDTGDIIWQEPYIISKGDYSKDIHFKVYEAIKKSIRNCLKSILEGNIVLKKQNDDIATYLLIRRPEDGLIDWNNSAEDIHKLIRATSRPYPGAFTYYEGTKIIIWEADIIEDSRYIGINGQIAKIEDEYIYIVVDDKLICLRDIEIDSKEDIKFIVGKKLKK